MRTTACDRALYRAPAACAGILLLAASAAPAQVRTAAAVASTPAAAAEPAAPTFYRDVLPILQQNCQVCHGTSGLGAGGLVAPMALETYEDAQKWAPAIAIAVREGRMPPWGAHVQHEGTFIGERYLADGDRRTLIAWAEAGAPAGDPAHASTWTAAPAETKVGEWWLGEPDLVVGFAEPVPVGDEINDWQPTIHVPVFSAEHDEPRWIKSSELKPGGPYVHHIVSSHLGVGTPGRGAFEYPPGFGILLPEDPVVTFNMHYYKTPGPGTGVLDDTRGAIKFYEDGEVIDYIVQTDLNWNRDFVIPAGAENHEVRREMKFEEDTYLLSMGPHMHKRGKAVKMELEYPDGRMETLLYVPRYDFNWQFLYQFKEPFLMPAGSTLHTTWWFDNSANNPHNPDPTVDVRYGIETFHEMANARIYFAPAKKRGIVAGGPIPPDVLDRARQEEDRRREQLERTGAVEDH